MLWTRWIIQGSFLSHNRKLFSNQRNIGSFSLLFSFRTSAFKESAYFQVSDSSLSRTSCHTHVLSSTSPLFASDIRVLVSIVLALFGAAIFMNWYKNIFVLIFQLHTSLSYLKTYSYVDVSLVFCHQLLEPLLIIFQIRCCFFYFQIK